MFSKSVKKLRVIKGGKKTERIVVDMDNVLMIVINTKNPISTKNAIDRLLEYRTNHPDRIPTICLPPEDKITFVEKKI